MLQTILQSLMQLSRSDSALNQRIFNLHHFLSDPKNVNGEDLLSILKRARDIASAYDIGNDKQLPHLFFRAEEELEHMIRSKKLMSNDKVARLASIIEKFSQFASK